MFDPGPANPFMYGAHVILGLSAVLFGLLAIFSTKGSTFHKRVGKVFAIAMLVASFTALYFMTIRYNEPATVSAIGTIYGIGAGILTLRKRGGVWSLLERFIYLIPIGMMAFQTFIFISMVRSENPPPPIVLLIVIFVFAIFALFAIGDLKYLISKDVTPGKRFKRHALRVGLAVSETVRAPLITFAPPFFGSMSFLIYFTVPYVIILLVYYFAMPKWIKEKP